MESYYSNHRKERLEYQKQRYLQLKDEISHYNAEYYKKNIDKITKERKINIIKRNIHKLNDQINDLTNLTEDILNKHYANSKYYKVIHKYKTKKNISTTDTVSIEFD